MHPPLTLSKHPLCAELVQKLKRCHEVQPWYKKWTGICNQQKWELDKCLKAQKLFKAKINRERGEKYKDRLKRRVLNNEEEEE